MFPVYFNIVGIYFVLCNVSDVIFLIVKHLNVDIDKCLVLVITNIRLTLARTKSSINTKNKIKIYLQIISLFYLKASIYFSFIQNTCNCELINI